MKTDRICPKRGAVLIAFIVIGLVCLEMAPVFGQETSHAGTRAPDWELADLNGKMIKFSDFRDKVVILDFWATWCVPCREEIPHFVELQKQYGAKGLAIVGVSLDQQGPNIVKQFVKEFGVNYPVVMASDKVVADYGGIEGVPTTFIIDKKGRIVGKHVGYEEKQTLEKEIQRLL
jgi:thiol-disulfide isomerase/thioredoxin